MRPKILIVDDEVEIVEVLTDVFTLYDFEVLAANDGLDALQILDIHIPDIILSDFKMPECDGKTLFEKIRSNPDKAGIPFIFMTANPEPLLSLTANAILKKPVELNALLVEVKKALPQMSTDLDFLGS